MKYNLVTKALVLFGGVVLLGVSLVYLFHRFESQKFQREVSMRTELRSRLETEYYDANRLVFSEQYAEAIPELENYLRHTEYLSSLGKGEFIGLAEIQLAIGRYFCGERERAIRSLVDIILAPSYSGPVRAVALVQLGNFFLEDFDGNFIRDTLSSSGEMKKLLVEGNPKRSAENLYREALRMDSHVMRKKYFGIGDVTLFQIFLQGGYDGHSDRMEGVITPVYPSGNSLTDSERVVLDSEIALFQALAVLGDYTVLSEEQTSEIRRMFESSIQTSAQFGKSTLRKKYEYLRWALRMQNNNAELMQGVLSDFTQELRIVGPRQESFLRFLANMREYQGTIDYETVIQLGVLDEEVKEILLNQGWEETALRK